MRDEGWVREREPEWNERKVRIGEEMRKVLVGIGRKEKGGKSGGDEEGTGKGVEEKG